MNQKVGTGLGIIIILIIAITVGVFVWRQYILFPKENFDIISFNSQPEQNNEEKDNPRYDVNEKGEIVIDAEDYCRFYSEDNTNTKRADEIFYGKTIILSGEKYGNAGKLVSGKTSFLIKCYKEKWGGLDIACLSYNSPEEVNAKLEKTEKLTVRGIGGGIYESLEIENCEIIDPAT